MINRIPFRTQITFTIFIICLILIILPSVPKSYGHAFVIKSSPSPSQSLSTPPSKLDVYFSEPVDIRYSKLTVIDSNGKEIGNKDIHTINNDPASLSITLPSGLKDGVYTVSTKVLSQVDGHVTENAFVFGVGSAVIPNNPSNAPSSSSQLYLPDAIARFPALVGQVMIVGATFATLWLWRPISKISWLKDSFQQTRKRIDRSTIILTIIGSIILLASDFGMIFVQAISINIGIGEAISTKFGSVWIIRVVESLVLLAISLGIYYYRPKKSKDLTLSKNQVVSILTIGILTLVTTSLIGHGASNGQLLPITIDFIHNLAASLWIGGVIYLAFVVVPKIKQAMTLEQYVKNALLSIIIPRFSTIPVTILGVIVITGPLLLYVLESNLDLTLASLYGKVLIIKLLLAAVMIAIGGYNQMILQRRVFQVTILATSSGSSSSSSSSAYNDNSQGYKKRWKKSGADSRNAKGTDNSDDANKKTNSGDDGDGVGTHSLISRFSKSTRAEAIVGIALLAAVSVLVNTGLPASQFQNLLQQQQQSADLALTSGPATAQGFTATQFIESSDRIVLSISPFAPGNNNFKISFLDSSRHPIDIKSVQMKLTETEKGIGPIKVDTRQISKGVFSANAAFGVAGKWDIQIEGVQGKPNSPNLIAIYANLNVKPSLNQLKFNVKEFKIPGNKSQPLYPLYDKSRNAIWVGDTKLDSGRIFELDLNSGKYIEHKVNGTSIVTVMALDANNKIWYVDPLMKLLGLYDPITRTNQVFKITDPQFIPSGIAIESVKNTNNSGNKNNNNEIIWLTSSRTSDILRFNTQSKNFTTLLSLPTKDASPLGITIDSTGQIWIAEGAGKLANLDPAKNYTVTEYSPKGKNNTLLSPTALLADPETQNIYISEHDGHRVSVFNPILKSFKRYPPLDPNGLPFGMALDSFGNLWVAEHTINKIGVIDPQTGTNKEIEIPSPNPFVQWISSDSKGQIWFAEQRGNSLGVITANVNLQSNVVARVQKSDNSNSNSTNQPNSNNAIPKLGFSYTDIIGPSIASGIIISALFYAKSIVDLKKSVVQASNRKR